MSRTGSTLADWLVRLDGFSPHEIDLGLGRVRYIMDTLELALPNTVLHVAGTNGKGSTVALLQSLLGKSGNVIGAYTSPHIIRYNERIAIAGNPVSDDDIVAAFERIESVRGDIPLTYFEYSTVAALVVFEAYAVDTAILEVGMGGRLDAVNAIEPTAGIITNVALDHCDWLGNDVETIAMEKAGIMRASKPIIYASTDVPDAIHQQAATTGAELLLAGRDYQWEPARGDWRWQSQRHSLVGLKPLALKGSMQLANAAGALALLEAASFDDLLDAEAVNDAFGGVSLAGRMQTVHLDRDWLLDVAHNPAAAEALADTLAEESIDGRTIAIVGMLEDKHVEGVVSALAPAVDNWIAVKAASRRAIDVEELARQIANASSKGCLEALSIEDALGNARRLCGDNDRILVTGSFYVVGPVLEVLGLYSPR